MCLDQALYGLHEPVAIRQAQDACLRKACDRRKLREQPKTARVVTQGTKSACTQVYRCTGPLCTKQGGRSKGRQQAGRLCGTGQEKDAVLVEREAEKNCRTGQHRIGVRKQRQTHVRTSACPHVCPSGPQGPQGDREDGCSSAMQGLACVIGQQKRSATSLALLPFFHTAPAMSIRFSRHVRSRTPSGHVGRPGQGQGKVSCPCRTTDWYHFSFFFCALTLLSAAQGKHEWTAMKSTGSCFSQKKALRHPLRLCKSLRL